MKIAIIGAEVVFIVVRTPFRDSHRHADLQLVHAVALLTDKLVDTEAKLK